MIWQAEQPGEFNLVERGYRRPDGRISAEDLIPVIHG